MLVVVGLSHKTAPLSVRERLAVPRADHEPILRRLVAQPAVGEAMLLSTCNRVEVYAAPRARSPEPLDFEATARAVSEVLVGIGGDSVRSHLVRGLGDDAVLHLFRVAASLDSLVIGEAQILGQLKEAVSSARAASTIGPTLGAVAHRAVKAGKRVRSQTAIGAGQVSVPSVAVDLARQIFGELPKCSALLVGAGEMAEMAARLLGRAGAKIAVLNRSPERAEAIAREVGGEARRLDELAASLVKADIVVCSTSSPGYVVSRELVRAAQRARRGRSLFFIDIAVPRDVDPRVNELDNVYLYDVDDLARIAGESVDGRAAEAELAETIVRAETHALATWTLERALTPVIVGLRARARTAVTAELERSLAGKLKHLPAADRQALGTMVDAAVSRLLHAPITRLRALAADGRGAEHAEALRELFELPEMHSADLGEELAESGDRYLAPLAAPSGDSSEAEPGA